MLPTRRPSTNTLQTPTIMPSKRENQGKSHVISPVLFMTVDGEPMRFYLCPGLAKVELLPHIKAGGGMVCKVQEPGAVLLVDPNEMGSLTESTAHWYVSAQYIRDCIQKNEQLELEDYRMKPDTSTKKRTAKTSPTNMSSGRIPYTSKEDAAIIGYVATRTDKLKGNLLWQEMETSRVTHHSWQSMKYHYIHKLMDRPTEAQEEGRPNGVSKGAENQKTGVGGSPLEKQMASSSDDLTSSVSAQADDQQTDDRQADDPPMEAGSSESTNIESGSPPVPDVTPEEEEEEDDEEEEDEAAAAPPPAGLPESRQRTPSPMRVTRRKMPKKVASPVTPQPDSFRLLMLPDTPPLDSPSRKKARTLSPLSTPEASTSAATPSSRATPPPRQPVECNQSPDGAADPLTQREAEKKGKRKEKRKLGILEMATKEFEDDSESDYEETADLPETMNTHPPREMTSEHPAGTPAVPMETRTLVETGSTPKPHLFIFDTESQEEGSQPMDYEDAAVPAGPQPIGKKAEVESLTQVQLKEDMQRIRELMKQTNQDLVSVTKALLKTSGDFSAALALLLNPDSARGPFWSRYDDRLLLSSDPEARRQLQKRYGEQGVAKRVVFLEGMNDMDEPL